MKRIVVLAIASLVMTAAVRVDRAYGAHPGQGQWRWGSGPMPQAGACFFDDTNFRGQYFCVAPGDNVVQLPRGVNDKLSSLRIVGPVEVTVFKNTRFKGSWGRFSTDVRDLRKEGWNDKISSLRVTNESTTWDRSRFPEWGSQAMPREAACFYRDANFRGEYFCLPRGASYATVPPGFNDRISSIRINRAGGVLIFRDRDFDGAAVRITSDVADLRRGVWNDRISSIRVY